MPALGLGGFTFMKTTDNWRWADMESAAWQPDHVGGGLLGETCRGRSWVLLAFDTHWEQIPAARAVSRLDS